jgi:DNA-binding Xre family transcriptional regulator
MTSEPVLAPFGRKLDRKCDSCHGQGGSCSVCGGKGFILTREGVHLLTFLSRHWVASSPPKPKGSKISPDHQAYTIALPRLRQTRKERYLTLQELSRLTGFSLRNILRLEQGKSRARFSTVKELARVLKVEPSDLQ